MDTTLITNYFELYGGLAIFVIVLLEYLNLPGFPAGIIMPLAGVYAAKGGLSLLSAITISVAAGELGSWILYFLGAYGGNAFLKRYLNKFPKHEPAINRTFELIRRKGYYFQQTDSDDQDCNFYPSRNYEDGFYKVFYCFVFRRNCLEYGVCRSRVHNWRTYIEFNCGEVRE